jgi:hypothetical protein
MVRYARNLGYTLSHVEVIIYGRAISGGVAECTKVRRPASQLYAAQTVAAAASCGASDAAR